MIYMDFALFLAPHEKDLDEILLSFPIFSFLPRLGHPFHSSLSNSPCGRRMKYEESKIEIPGRDD